MYTFTAKVRRNAAEACRGTLSEQAWKLSDKLCMTDGPGPDDPDGRLIEKSGLCRLNRNPLIKHVQIEW